MEDERNLAEYHDESPEYSEDPIQNTDALEKKYITKLRSIGIPNHVIMWIENEMFNVTRRIHTYNNATLAAYVILGCQSCKYDCDIPQLLESLEIPKKKKQVLSLVSGISTLNTPIHDASISIPIIVKCPSEMIEIVVELYYTTQKFIIPDNFSRIVADITHFTKIFCDSCNSFRNFEPKSCASAFVYFYISKFSMVDTSNERAFSVKKTHFKNMKFGTTKNKEGVNPKSFDQCYDKIDKIFSEFCSRYSQSDVEKLIMCGR